MAIKVALMGAGGKMGCRITDNIKDRPEYEVYYVEISEQGIENLKARGLDVTPQDEALAQGEVVVLALPDKLIGRITDAIIPKLKPGTMVIGLDPAAAYAEVMPIRDDLIYFVTHPCHPPLFNDDVAPEKRTDWFGGVEASQHIVCALHHGSDEDYAKGEALAIAMYGNERCPVIESHRITVEQMAILEPALVETTAAALIQAIKELGERAIDMGVPRPAMEAFLSGHIRTELAIIFGHAGFPFSDGALLAIEKAQARILQPNWMDNVMTIDALKHSVAEITDSLENE